jgi:hypothetical protein
MKIVPGFQGLRDHLLVNGEFLEGECNYAGVLFYLRLSRRNSKYHQFTPFAFRYKEEVIRLVKDRYRIKN